MAEITCRKCGQSYPPTREYWYWQHGIPKKPCKACTLKYQHVNNQRWRQKHKVKALAPRQCVFCKDIFVPKSIHANRRTHCYKQGCIIKAHRQYDNRRVINARAWKKTHKPIQFKKCPLCGKYRMEPQDRFSCWVCRKRAGDCSGNWVYLVPMGNEFDMETKNL